MAVAGRILEQFGQIDVLVASAGINVKERNWHNVSLEDWDSVIRIDLDGAFYCCKAVLPAMKEQGGGKIITIGSMMVVIENFVPRHGPLIMILLVCYLKMAFEWDYSFKNAFFKETSYVAYIAV